MAFFTLRGQHYIDTKLHIKRTVDIRNQKNQTVRPGFFCWERKMGNKDNRSTNDIILYLDNF